MDEIHDSYDEVNVGVAANVLTTCMLWGCLSASSSFNCAVVQPMGPTPRGQCSAGRLTTQAMRPQVTSSIVEYTLVFVLPLLIGMAVLQWLWPFISSPAMYPMFRPMGIFS